MHLLTFFINELMLSCKHVAKFAIARELVGIYKFMPTCELVPKFDANIGLQLLAMQFTNTF
jgi:hypothetical protein